MNRKSEARKSATDHRLGFLLLLMSPVPALIAVRIAALLTPATPETKISFGSEPWISRRMSCRKVITADSSDQAATDRCGMPGPQNANAHRKKRCGGRRRSADGACRSADEAVEGGPSSFWPRAQRPPSLRRNKDVSKCLSRA